MMSDSRPDFNRYSQELREKLKAACDEEGLIIGGRGGQEGGFLRSVQAAVQAGEGNISFVLFNAAEQWPEGSLQRERLMKLKRAVDDHKDSARNRDGHYELDQVTRADVLRKMEKGKK